MEKIRSLYSEYRIVFWGSSLIILVVALASVALQINPPRSLPLEPTNIVNFVSQTYLILVAAIVFLVLLAIDKLVSQDGDIDNKREELIRDASQNDFTEERKRFYETYASYTELLHSRRKELAQLVGGGLFIFTIALTFAQYTSSQNIQVSERFQNAIQQLVSTNGKAQEGEAIYEEASVTNHLAGIYSLEKIARESPENTGKVVRVLASFVQEGYSSNIGFREKLPLEEQKTLKSINREIADHYTEFKEALNNEQTSLDAVEGANDKIDAKLNKEREWVKGTLKKLNKLLDKKQLQEAETKLSMVLTGPNGNSNYQQANIRKLLQGITSLLNGEKFMVEDLIYYLELVPSSSIGIEEKEKSEIRKVLIEYRQRLDDFWQSIRVVEDRLKDFDFKRNITLKNKVNPDKCFKIEIDMTTKKEIPCLQLHVESVAYHRWQLVMKEDTRGDLATIGKANNFISLDYRTALDTIGELAKASAECKVLWLGECPKAVYPLDQLKNSLKNVNFFKMPLVGIKLPKMDLTGSNLYNANLANADLEDSWLKSALLDRANLINANLKNAHLTSAFMKESILSGADMSDADANSALLTKASLIHTILERTKLQYAVMNEADLRKAKATSADLSNAVLDRALLMDADFTKATLINAKLRDANLSGADLRYADLRYADLRNADLTGAKLENTCMSKDIRSLVKPNTITELQFRKARILRSPPRPGDADTKCSEVRPDQLEPLLPRDPVSSGTSTNSGAQK